MPRTHRIFAALRAAFPVSTPVLAGYLFLGAGYGVLMHSLGYGPGWTVAFSMVVFGGTIQYVATQILAAQYAPVHALVISLILNARHLFYGFSMLGRYAGTGWKKPLLIFWLTDETFSLVCSDDVPPGVDAGWYRLFISGLDYLYWIVGSIIGNVAGTAFAFNTTGIDFVMTSLFTVIVLSQWRSARTHSPAVIGVGASVLCIFLFGPANFLIPAMALIVTGLLLSRRRLEARVLANEDGEASP
ncbi:MAG: AzlC family ABC transporter permease [Planctomycetaceae bacterium]|nr:AzlC family ABC transporter permease [Planctomycetaceae bacterium]